MTDFLSWLAGDNGRDLPMALTRSACLGMGVSFSVALLFQLLADAAVSGIMYGYLSAGVWTYAVRSAKEETDNLNERSLN